MEASGAGQMETFLGVSGIDKVSKNYQLISGGNIINLVCLGFVCSFVC